MRALRYELGANAPLSIKEAPHCGALLFEFSWILRLRLSRTCSGTQDDTFNGRRVKLSTSYRLLPTT